MPLSTKFPPGTEVFYTSSLSKGRRRGVVAPFDHPEILDTPQYKNPRVWAFWGDSKHPTHVDERTVHLMSDFPLLTGTLYVSIKQGQIQYSHEEPTDVEIIAIKKWEHDTYGH